MTKKVKKISKVLASFFKKVHKPLSKFQRRYKRITKPLSGLKTDRPHYDLTRSVFLKALGIIYLAAFVSYGVQVAGLFGSEGIVPIAEYLDMLSDQYGALGYYLTPSIHWLSSSDIMLKLVPMAGGALSLLLIFGFAERYALALLFLLYLSIVSTGRVFMGHQWDNLLLETGFLTFIFSFAPVFIWMLRLLLFRFVFMAGIVKFLSHDTSWRDLTAMSHFYENQPLPNAFSWYLHQLPMWFDKAVTGILLFIQIIVPFFIFAPRRVRIGVAAVLAVTQFIILLSGNFNFFYLTGLALCILLIDDQVIKRFIKAKYLKRIKTLKIYKSHWARTAVISVLILFLLIITGSYVSQPFRGKHPDLLAPVVEKIAPLHLVNNYGLFAYMPQERPEIIIQGSDDKELWFNMNFKYKPDRILKKRPAWATPHQPRLDWQLRVATNGNYQTNPWFVNFAKKLLDGSEDINNLLAKNPYGNEPPKYIKALVFNYEFTNFSERKETGEWWKKGEFLGEYLPPVSLKDFYRGGQKPPADEEVTEEAPADTNVQ